MLGWWVGWLEWGQGRDGWHGVGCRVVEVAVGGMVGRSGGVCWDGVIGGMAWMANALAGTAADLGRKSD